jgi:hypothetical protein
MDDLISRQAAIEAIDDYLNEYSGLDEEGYHGEKWCAMAEAKMVIENLQSAQPEIIRCKDCKHLKKWRSEESAKKFGQIYECARNVFDCPKPEDFCSRAERKE